jgi:hypothetical protein
VLNALQQQPAASMNGVPHIEKLGLPKDATIDPFTGSPLHLRKTAGGWIIYSNGSNLADDGGRLEDLKDVGIGPVRTP